MIRLRASRCSSFTVPDEETTRGFVLLVQIAGRVVLELWITAR